MYAWPFLIKVQSESCYFVVAFPVMFGTYNTLLCWLIGRFHILTVYSLVQNVPNLLQWLSVHTALLLSQRMRVRYQPRWECLSDGDEKWKRMCVQIFTRV